MKTDKEIVPEKNKTYLVEITDPNHPQFGKQVTIKFTGIFLRSLKTKNVLFLSQCEILKEAETEDHA